MNKDEALKLALEALERAERDGGWSIATTKAIAATKQALAAQPAPVEPDWKAEYLKSVESGCITLDELREARAELDATNRQVEILSDALAESRREVAAIKQALEQPVQEPDGCRHIREQDCLLDVDEKAWWSLVENRGGCRCHISPPCGACSNPISEEELNEVGYTYNTPTAAQPAPDLQAEFEATNRQVEILSDALAESRREVAALKAVQEPVAWMHTMIDDVVVGHQPADLNVHPDRWMPLYKDPTPCQTCEALARTVMMDQTAHDTTPPAPPAAQRQWVGLTDEERDAIFELHHTRLGGWDHGGDEVIYDKHFEDAVAAIEAKLKEKNTAAQPAPEQYTALEQALTRLQKRYAELEAKAAAQPAPVPLTDEEIDAIRFSIPTKAVTQRDFELARAIEAKLKQKNAAAQPAVPDAMTSADIQEHIEYVAGWNDCRAAMLEILKARGNT